MPSRKWRVKCLNEFLPRSDRLLGQNWNRGDRVEIRLRKSKQYASSFLSLEEIVGTLLHELVHNSIGPHRAPFKKLLAEITLECENSMVSKFTITTILDCGFSLGGDLEAYKTYAQRDLSRFAAESRMILALPDVSRAAIGAPICLEDESEEEGSHCIIVID